VTWPGIGGHHADLEIGRFDGARILVAHWCILDGKALPARREKGSRYRLELERFDDNPQLQAERLVSDFDDIDLTMYYDSTR